MAFDDFIVLHLTPAQRKVINRFKPTFTVYVPKSAGAEFQPFLVYRTSAAATRNELTGARASRSFLAGARAIRSDPLGPLAASLVLTESNWIELNRARSDRIKPKQAFEPVSLFAFPKP